jgi:hypothetical protein
VRSYAIRAAIIASVAAVALLGCSNDSANGPDNSGTYTVADLEGYWAGQIAFTINGTPLDPFFAIWRFDEQGRLLSVGTNEEDSVGGQLGVTTTGVISGNVVSYDDMYFGDYLITAPVEFTCTGHFVSKSELTTVCTASGTDTSGADVLLLIESTLYKEDAGFEYVDVTLNRWEIHTGTWWLNIKAYAQDATRVYATGGIIVGEYDLYECGTLGYLDYWWSSNNAECLVGDNNYSIHYDPTLPFDVVIHIVKPSGTTTHTVTISDYNIVEGG